MFERAVSRKLLLLMDELLKIDLIKEFHLAGETALALHLGHRRSLDIDLFSQNISDMIRIRGSCRCFKWEYN